MNTTDARVLFELDCLYKRTNKKPADRLCLLKKHVNLVESRDDLFTEFVTLHNLLGMNDEAASLLQGRNFHPWEGGEGKVSGQYIITCVGLAKKALAVHRYDTATTEIYTRKIVGSVRCV